MPAAPDVVPVGVVEVPFVVVETPDPCVPELDVPLAVVEVELDVEFVDVPLLEVPVDVLPLELPVDVLPLELPVDVLPLELPVDVDEEEPDETLEADAPVRSTMNVSIRVEQPKDVSAPSAPSQ